MLCLFYMVNLNKLIDTPEDFASEYYRRIVHLLERGVFNNPKIKFKLLQSSGGSITPIGMRELLSRLVVFFNGDTVSIEKNGINNLVILEKELPEFEKITLIKKGLIRENAEKHSKIFNSFFYKKEVEEEAINHFSKFLDKPEGSIICEIFNVQKTNDFNEFIKKANFPVLDVWEVSFLWRMPEWIFSGNYNKDVVLEIMNKDKNRYKSYSEELINMLSKLK